MDLNAIKSRLSDLNQQSQNRGGSKNLFWKPSIGKQQIRVVPSKFNEKMPFTEMMFYYNIGPKRVMASPMNWGEKDPIAEFAKQLRSSGDKENWKLAKQIDPKTRIFAPIVVRGEEDEGVRLWQFGKEIYESFLQMATDEEIGDFTDVYEGRDIKLNTVGPESTGTPYNRTTISPSMKVSPLDKEEEKVQEFLDNQADPKKVFKPLSYDEMKENLQQWLSPEEEESSTPEPQTQPQTTGTQYSSASKPKQSKEDKFNSLFEDESKGEDDPLF